LIGRTSASSRFSVPAITGGFCLARCHADWQTNFCRRKILFAVSLSVDELAKTKLDRTHFSVAKLSDSHEKAYWLSKSPAERFAAIELMRQIIYGYDRARTRLQRVFTVVSLADLKKRKNASGISSP
jgi:hypothetical protein